MAFVLDTASEFGARVARRLEIEAIAWLTTVAANGTPAPLPVWFLWDGATFLVYSRPGQAKLANIERSPRVTLNLDGDGRGGDIVVVTGEARIAREEPPADRVPAYVDKYAWAIMRIGMTPSSFADAYSVPIRIVPRTLRGH